MNALRRLWQYTGKYRGTVVSASIFSVLNKLFDVMPEILIGVAVDTVVKKEHSFLAGLGVSEPFHQVSLLGVATLLIWGFESLFEYLYSLRWRALAQAVQHELRQEAYGHMQQLEMHYFENQATGRLMSVLNDDVNQLERFLDNGANDILQLGVGSLLVTVVFFVLAPEIAVFAMLPIPVILIGAFYFQNRIAPLYAGVRDQAGLMNSRLANNLLGIATIKSFTREEFELQQIEQESHRYQQANRKAIRVSAAFIPIIRMAIMAGFIATLVYGGWLTLQGTLEVGSYSVLVFLTQRLLWPFTRLAETVDQYQRAMASTNRIFGILDTRPTIVGGSKTLPQPLRGEISFEHVFFSYKDREPIFRDLTLHIQAGETVGIVGETGSGKSTLMKLLLRFYDPQRGSITIDGTSIRDVTLDSLRGSIAFVSQDVFLFHGTVLENIRYGNPSASEEDVHRAAEIAEAHDFITELPQAYHTVVGERGMKLSGGQRQRISIARAVLKNAPILVFDEATSSVDNETEAAIQRSIRLLSKDRTTFIIAHRLSTVRHAHKIVVLGAGSVLDQGTHEQLIARKGVYHELWNVQTGEKVQP